MTKTPLLSRPLGSSDLDVNEWKGTCSNGPEVCEVCGTEHPAVSMAAEDDHYVVKKIDGYNVVKRCCGIVVDQLVGCSNMNLFEITELHGAID